MTKKEDGLPLVYCEPARLLDAEASSSWGLNPFTLVEAAGRACALSAAAAYPERFGSGAKVSALAGSGNNGADAMVMLRVLIFQGLLEKKDTLLVINRLNNKRENENDAPYGSPRGEALAALQALGVPCFSWEEDPASAAEALSGASVIIDGISGTGLSGPPRGAQKEMILALNARKSIARESTLILSVDIPSGAADRREGGWPLVEADATLAVEPVKACLYNPAARKAAGKIIHVKGIFPKALMERYSSCGLWSWEEARRLVPPLSPDAYKYTRGTIEIHAGSVGSAGAARIAARGASAAGGGLIRLMADASIYPILAAGEGGVMVAKAEGGPGGGRFEPDALLLGPGWGREAGRTALLERALELEKGGMPLVLDADAVILARGKRFGGNVLLTPHPGELAAFSGMEREEFSTNTGEILRGVSRNSNAFILFKSHVLWIAAPDGRLGVVDGMLPVLGTGGTGDLLAGFAAALAARMKRARDTAFDWFPPAIAAAALLVETGKETAARAGFIDPLDMASFSAKIAAGAWLEPPGLPGV